MKKTSINKIIKLFKTSNNIVVFSGAGISTNCGIPDFRSENGLYKMIEKKYNLPYPEAIFDINYFKKNPEPFFNLSKGLFSNKVRPSKCHEFIAWLENIGKISLIVTQNIDMLHKKAGSKKVIECHGTYSTAHCIDCNKKYKIDEIRSQMTEGIVPYCDCNGIIKPDITFFGEQLPNSFYNILQNPPEADLLLILGSSLTVHPASLFPVELSYKVPSVLVNLEPTQYDNILTHVLHEDLDKFTSIVWEELKNNEL